MRGALFVKPDGWRQRAASCLVLLATIIAWTIVPAVAETRIALVVGNSAYQHTTALANPGNDARDMAAALKSVGFDVTEAIDADKRSFERALRDFTDKLAKADVALLFYAGHGLQVGQENWLVPIDARLERERDLAFEAIKLDFVLQQMEIDRQGKTTIVLLDACRDNPLARNLARSMGTRSASVGRGLATPPSTGLGTFIAYATQPGNVALDGDGTRNSPFTAALLKEMRAPGRSLPATMIEVRKGVVAATGGRQVPWDHSALTGDFQFVRGAPVVGGAAGMPAPGGGPGSAEVAALEARLKQLEADAKRREEEAKKGASLRDPFVHRSDNWLTGNRILDRSGVALAECRNQCRDDASCIGFDWFASESGGMCRHYDRVEQQASKSGWRSGVRRTGVNAKTAPSFVVRLDQRIAGTALPAPPSTANCESRCRTVDSCIAWSLSKQGECELFSTVDRHVEDRQWRSGIRADVWAEMVATKSAAATPQGPAAPPIEPRAARPSGATSGLSLDDNVRVDGNRLGEPSRAPSADACRQRCGETAGCVGFMHGKKIPDMGQCHLFDRVDRRQEDPAWRSGVGGGGTSGGDEAACLNAAGEWSAGYTCDGRHSTSFREGCVRKICTLRDGRRIR